LHSVPALSQASYGVILANLLTNDTRLIARITLNSVGYDAGMKILSPPPKDLPAGLIHFESGPVRRRTMER
jgi:hypothetical protein